MMADYQALAAAWAGLSGAAEDRLAALNAQNVAGPNRDVAVGEVESYLSLSGKLSVIEAWSAANPVTTSATPTAAQIAARELLRTLESPHIAVFRTSDPAVYAQLQGMLDALAGTTPPLLEAGDISSLLGFAATTLPWWQAHGFDQPIGTADLTLAGLG